MADSNNYPDISPIAVKCGRIAFWLYGSAFFVIGFVALLMAGSEFALLASAMVVIGMVSVILGFALPPKLVAHMGFLLPW